MELCSGGELFEYIMNKGCLSETEATKILKKLLSSVSYLHKHGIVHWDLKPENFLFIDKSSCAEIKMIDFSLAKKFGKCDNVKQMNTMVGSTFFVAPEVLSGNYGSACDIWSIGVIFHMMLVGYPPYDGANNIEIFASI